MWMVSAPTQAALAPVRTWLPRAWVTEIQVAGGWKSPTMVARSEALDIGRGAVAKLATLQNR